MYKFASGKRTFLKLKATKYWLIPSNSLRIMSLCTCALTFTLTLNHIYSADGSPNQKEEYKVIDELVVNSENKYKTIIYKSEDKGISEMRDLLESSQIEEAWAYLPHQKKWIEVGYNEETEKKINKRYITKAKLDVQFLDGLMNENNNMVLYHFHTSYCLSLEDKIRKREGEGLPMNDKEIEKERIRLLIKSVYPSKSDLTNMIANSIAFFERNPNGKITFKIGSHYGITEYHLTEEGIAHFYNNNPFKQMARIKSISSSANLEANITGEILELDPRQTRNPLSRIKMNPKQKRNSLSRFIEMDPISRAKKSVEAMNDERLRVTFTPYE